jgi:hypothetical protein
MELSDDLRRARSAESAGNAASRNEAAPDGERLLAQLQQLVLQHQRRIDQLDEALRLERAARIELETTVAAIRRSLEASGSGASAGSVPLLMSPEVASPPHCSIASVSRGRIRQVSDAEPGRVWGEFYDEVQPQ